MIKRPRNSSSRLEKCSPFSWIRPSSGCVASRVVCVASRVVCLAVACCSVWCQWCAGRARAPALALCSVAQSAAGCKPAAEDERELSPGGESRQHQQASAGGIAAGAASAAHLPVVGDGWIGLSGSRAVPPKRAGCVRPVERDERGVESASRRLAPHAPQVCMYRVWVLTGPCGCLPLEQERKQRAHAL